MKDAQENSFQSQQEYFTEYIQRHPGWVFAGMYADDTAIMGLNQNPVQTGVDLVPFFFLSALFSANEGVPTCLTTEKRCPANILMPDAASVYGGT